MLRLNITAAPQWLTLFPGLRLLLAPLSTAMMIEARADAMADRPAETASDADLAVLMAQVIARRAILDWEGVGDAEGNPVPVSRENIDALLQVWPVFEAFQLLYVQHGLVLEQEKNVSAPSPTGTSAGATDTARPALPPAPTAPPA